MHDAPEFLKNLALVLCVAAATSLLFQRLRQPVVFGYLIAGMLVGPHIPVPLVADAAMVRSLSELGVVLVMFSLGLEFRLRSLLRVGQTAGLIALIECSAMLWLGFTAAHLLGWSTKESLFAGAFVAISSTTILVKSFNELGIKGKVTEVVFGVLIFEDLIAILLLAVLTAVAAGGALTAAALGVTIGRLLSFLFGLVGVGLLVVPRLMRYVVRAGRPELTLVSSVGICFASALLALTFGYSVALGAFIAGSLVAESGKGSQIAHLVEPVRDLFAAIFFVSVGMLIDPALVAQHWGAVVLFTLLVVIGKTVFVSVGAFFAGHSPRTAVRAGMSLSQIGEFSFIIAGLGISAGATRNFLYPVAVAVSAITSLGTSWMIRASGPAASWLDARLPKPVQTFVALYGSWIERVRAVPAHPEPPGVMRRQVRALAIDGFLLATTVILANLESHRFAGIVGAATGVGEAWAWLIVATGAALVGTPLVIGIVRNARLLGAGLAARAMPNVARGRLDLAASPRKALVVTLQFAVLALVGAPLLVVTQPFIPMLGSASLLAALAVLFAIVFWRRATDLYGHTRAGAEVIVMALAQHAMHQTKEMEVQTIERLHAVLPGLGEPVPVRLDEASRAVGRTLSSLDLRGRTGATVLAIRREGGDALVPTGHEVLRAGDVLAIAGSGESIEAARRKLGAH
jgi:CPA2 family monovalent cation:H+ antiporter-2